eukprot:9296295-Heterocapsa_arctica.AAC.1
MSYEGELLRKPWRVISTMPEIARLHRLCGHGHRHGVCHGVSATESSYYTPAFASEVGAMTMEKIEAQSM